VNIEYEMKPHCTVQQLIIRHSSICHRYEKNFNTSRYVNIRRINGRLIRLKEVPETTYFICFIFRNSQLSCAVTHPLFDYNFKSYLCSICSARNAKEAHISVIFP